MPVCRIRQPVLTTYPVMPPVGGDLVMTMNHTQHSNNRPSVPTALAGRPESAKYYALTESELRQAVEDIQPAFESLETAVRGRYKRDFVKDARGLDAHAYAARHVEMVSARDRELELCWWQLLFAHPALSV